MKNLILKLSLLFILLIQISIVQNVLAQCGTPESTDAEMQRLPWYGNNQYLYDFVDSLETISLTKENQRNINCDIDDMTIIPIRFWIYRESIIEIEPGGTTTTPPTELDLQKAMDVLNGHFQNNGMKIRFVMLPSEIIFDIDAVVIENNSEAASLNIQNRNNQAMNIHIVKKLITNSGIASGAFYSGDDFIIATRGAFSGAHLALLSHEIGHYFGLEHTHRNSTEKKCKQESVSRTRKFPLYCLFNLGSRICERSGDGFCDTPADPNLIIYLHNVQADCSYKGTETDNWGDTYRANPRNIMSYGQVNLCKDYFSPLQVGAMDFNLQVSSTPLSFVYGIPYRPFIKDVNDNFLNADRYEPDNSAEVARPIALGETQCHSFSTIQNFVDERDWLSIDNSNGVIGTYSINITPELGLDLVDDINIFYTDTNGNPTTQVAVRKHIKRNFVNGARSFIIEIPCDLVQGQDRLLVEVIRNGTEEGTYSISFKNNEHDYIIVSDDSKTLACSGDELTIGLTSNYALYGTETVKWTTENITLSNYTGINTTITGFTPVTTGIVYSISATITLNGCKQVLTKTFEGTEATFPDFEIVENFPACYGTPNSFGSYMTSPPTNVLWTVDHGTINTFNGTAEGIATIVNPTLNLNRNFTLTATFTNECGNEKSVSKTFFPEVCPQVFLRLSASPNPVSNILTVKIEDDAINGDYQVIINDQLATTKYQNTVSIKEFQVDVSKYRDSVYFLRVYGENYNESLKFIVNHTH